MEFEVRDNCSFKIIHKETGKVVLEANNIETNRISISPYEKVEVYNYNNRESISLTLDKAKINKKALAIMFGLTQRRKHKTKRINKKWAKKYGYIDKYGAVFYL